MSIRFPRPVPLIDKDTVIERKIRKCFMLLKNRKYMDLKQDSPSRGLCEAIGLYINGEPRKGCIKMYILLGISKQTIKNSQHRENLKVLLRELKNPQRKIAFA